jgi:hypothetical protein
MDNMNGGRMGTAEGGGVQQLGKNQQTQTLDPPADQQPPQGTQP